MLWVLEQLLVVRELDDVAEIHHRDAVGDVADDGEVVGDEEVGQPELVLEFAHRVQHLGLDRDVERARGFVTDDEVRVDGQGPREVTRCRCPPQNWWGWRL